MPVNVSEKTLPMVTAGFAKDVEDVNQYAAPMYEATIIAVFSFGESKFFRLSPVSALFCLSNRSKPYQIFIVI